MVLYSDKKRGGQRIRCCMVTRKGVFKVYSVVW